MFTDFVEQFRSEKVLSFVSPDIDYQMMAKYKLRVFDEDYFDFLLELGNGNFFFNGSFQLYSYSDSNHFNNIDIINSILIQEYGEIASDLFVFGQDIFANQFAFNSKDQNILFFNVETGERNILSSRFRSFIEKILGDIEYFTGSTFKKEYFDSIKYNERLCPKIPFVIGGKYSIDNLYISPFPNYIKANANIARQVFGLTDGQIVKIKIKH